MSTSSAKREREMLALLREECAAVDGGFSIRRKNSPHILVDMWGPQGCGIGCFTVSDVDPRAERNFRRDVRATLRNGKTQSCKRA